MELTSSGCARPLVCFMTSPMKYLMTRRVPCSCIRTCSGDALTSSAHSFVSASVSLSTSQPFALAISLASSVLLPEANISSRIALPILPME